METLNRLSHYSAHHILDAFNGSWLLFVLTILFLGMFLMSSGRDLYNLYTYRRRARRDQITARLRNVIEIDRSARGVRQ